MSLSLFACVLAAQTPSALAFIVTSNHGAETALPDLRYADDDAGNYAQLFGELLGEENVWLLTAFDPESLPRHPGWSERARPPTRAEVQRAAQELAARTREIAAQGTPPEVYIVLAGHGDLEHGQGYLALADGKMTSRELEAWIIAPLLAHRVHVILDSCNSYFMLNPRGAAARWEAPKEPEPSLLDKFPHVGALFSTSAEAVTYEWSELQSGIFSYLVRSGLRGGADADQDGQVSYVELTAFIELASRDVVNDLYRPKIFSQAPKVDTSGAFVRLQQRTPRTLTVPAPKARRVTLRDQDGVRVVDVHVEAGTRATLNLPVSATHLVAYETRGGVSQPMVARELGDGQSIVLDDLAAMPPALASRGESPVFRALFQSPYGPVALAQHLARNAAPPEPPTGVSQRDAERLRHHLQTAAAMQRDARLYGGVALGAMSVGLLAGGALSYLSADRLRYENRLGAHYDNAQWELESAKELRRAMGATCLAMGAAAALGSALVLGIQTGIEDVAEDYAEVQPEDERARAKHVRDTEARMAELVEEEAQLRRVAGVASIVAGAAGLAAGALMLWGDGASVNGASTYGGVSMGIGAMIAGLGIYQLTAFRYPIERTWDLYLGKTDGGASVALGGTF